MAYLLFCFILLLFLLIRKRKINLFSPILLFIIYYTLVIILTSLYYFLYNNSQKINLLNFDFISKKEFFSTLSLFLRMLCCFCLGYFIYNRISNIYGKLLKDKYSIGISKFLNRFSGNKNDIRYLLLLLCVVIYFYSVIYGDKFFIRNSYLIKGTSTELKILSTITSFLLIFAAILNIRVLQINKFWGILFGLLIMLLFIGTGSRIASVAFSMFMITFLFKLPPSLKRLLFIPIIIIIIIFFGYNMSLRGNQLHGLLPYLNAFNWTKIVDGITFTVYYSFIAGFFFTHATTQIIHINFHDIIISLNPLPGNMAGWYSISSRLSIAPGIAPSTGIGELSFFSGFFTFFFILLGFVYSFIEENILLMIKQKKTVVAFLILMLIILNIVTLFEYNLRSSTRFLYYALFILFASKMFKTKKKVHDNKI